MNKPYGRPPGQVGYGYPQQQPRGGHGKPQQVYGHPRWEQPQHGVIPPHGHGHGYGHPRGGHGAMPYPAPPAALAPDPHETRRTAGLVLWMVMMGIGVGLNIVFHLVEIFGAKNPERMFEAVLTGALFAFIPLGVYLFIPTILDRYDPEPWWCLAMVFLWGAVVATGFSGFINTMVHSVFGQVFGNKVGVFVTTVVSAPLVEEFWKGLAVLGVFYFLRREFDGVVDGIIYAIFCALGFAAVENISYYARSEVHHNLSATFFVRGILAPWGHPLYTSMTGIGFGLARESSKTWVRVFAPMLGYMFGVTLHAIWNLVPTVFGEKFFLLLPLWFIFVLGFLVIIVALVIRKGRTIRDYLRDEVLLGNLGRDELDLICSPIGRIKCTFSWRGATGREFIRAGARLALSKWHTVRAMQGQKRTISADFILPLRQELRRLRGEMLARMPPTRAGS
jgi:RsiW-degrading membrane proteinase PrsW (M82 family)